MPRLNVTKGLTANEKSRRQKFAKRKKCMLKKLSELSILCDVRVGLILYENEGSSDNSPEIYPQDPRVIKELITKYREQPKVDSKRWNTNLSSVLSSLKTKAETDITKLQESMMAKRPTSPTLLSHPSSDGINLEDLPEGQLAVLMELIDKKIEDVNRAYEFKQNQQRMRSPAVARRSHILDMPNQAVAQPQPIQMLDMNNTAQVAQPIQMLDMNNTAPPPSRLHMAAPIAVQQTIISHPDHPMQSMQYNVQLGTLYQHRQQSIMPFLYPQNVSIPTQYQVHETSSFNDGYRNQMEPSSSSAAAVASSQYENHVHHQAVGQYAMWYPQVNLKQPMLPYMQYYHGGMMSNGDPAKWQMKYSS